MLQTTVHLPEELETRLDAEATATGISRAEFIQRGIVTGRRARHSRALPVSGSGRPLAAYAMDDEIYEHIRERSFRFRRGYVR